MMGDRRIDLGTILSYRTDIKLPTIGPFGPTAGESSSWCGPIPTIFDIALFDLLYKYCRIRPVVADVDPGAIDLRATIDAPGSYALAADGLDAGTLTVV